LANAAPVPLSLTGAKAFLFLFFFFRARIGGVLPPRPARYFCEAKTAFSLPEKESRCVFLPPCPSAIPPFLNGPPEPFPTSSSDEAMSVPPFFPTISERPAFPPGKYFFVNHRTSSYYVPEFMMSPPPQTRIVEYSFVLERFS